MAGGMLSIVGAGMFKDEEECPAGLGIDVTNNGKPLRLFFSIEDCLLLEYVVQEARREHPVFFN